MHRSRINANTIKRKSDAMIPTNPQSDKQLAKPHRNTTEGNILIQAAEQMKDEAINLKDKVTAKLETKIKDGTKALEKSLKNKASEALENATEPDCFLRGPAWWTTFLRCGAPDPKKIQAIADSLGLPDYIDPQAMSKKPTTDLMSSGASVNIWAETFDTDEGMVS